MQRSTSDGTLKAFIAIHPLDPEDASAIIPIRTAARLAKGVRWSVDARTQFDALMERVSPRKDVTFESGTLGDVPGLWVHPASSRSGEAILHVHGGWFSSGSPTAYRHLVGHIAARAGARAFVPDYRLAPEHPFPAAVDDVLACYRGIDESGIRRIAITGDSSGGNLALLVRSYLGSADANDPLASPLQGRFSGLPPIRIHVGDDEVLLDDSRRYVERAVAAGVDARLDVWMGMPHGFVSSIGTVKASEQALDAIGMFLTERLQAGIHDLL